jgi:hypothetical protein
LRASASADRYCAPADRREIFRSAPEHEFELALRLVELIQLEQRASERDVCGEVTGMDRQAGATGFNRLVDPPRTAELLSELREGNRRRILLDPASKVLDARRVGHR